MKKLRARLDWSRLLGFDQADASLRDAPDRMAKLGERTSAKLSVKSGIKPSGSPLASQVGVKNTIRNPGD